jgi:hypothetical protein
MIRRDVAVLNRSSVVTDETAERYTKALKIQVTRDFAPFWGIDARVTFVPSTDLTSWKGKWNLVIADTSDEAGALGYHELTPEGLPVSYAFAKTDKLSGYSTSVTMSHEILEMLGDPNINLAAEGPGGFYAYENCDAVEYDGDGYHIEVDGRQVLVSDFVTPAWFSQDAPGPWDFRRLLNGPFELRGGGYISIFKNGSWTNDFNRPLVGSRTERRTVPRSAWRRSEP